MSQAARTLGGYVLETKLGEGGMGAVFKATHPRFPGHAFAIKIMRGDGPPNPQAVERFQRETQALARATAHPSIVRLLGAGVERDQPYYVMELAPGVSLDRLVAQEGPLEPKRAARLVREIAAAIAHAHGAGVVHRDLKPENVIVDTQAAGGETPRVCDFGLARLADSQRLTRSGAVLGTPAYSAPEQLSGQHAVAAPTLDIYSLGAVLFFLLTGGPPFESARLQELLDLVLNVPAPAPSTKRPGVPPPLDAIASKCLEKNPARRYPSAQALIEDLERFLAGRPVAAPLPRRSGGRSLRALGGVALVVTVVAGAVLLRRDRAAGGPGAGEGRAALLAAADQARVVLATPDSKPADLVAAAKQVAEAGGVLDVLFADEDAKSPGDLLVKRAVALRAADPSAAAAVLDAGGALVAARAAARPDDGSVEALRALLALAQSGAPTEPLGTGRIAPIASSIAPDLESGARLPGRIGRRAAWLAVDARLWLGEDDAARAALARASRVAHDAALERAFLGLLDAPKDVAGWERFATPARPQPGAGAPSAVGAAVLLQRFLGRCGAPGAIDDAAFAEGATDAALEAFVAAEEPVRFDFDPPPPEYWEVLGDLNRALEEMRESSDVPDEDRVTRRIASYRDRVLSLAHAALGRHEEQVLSRLVQIPQLGPSATLAAALDARRRPDSAVWLAQAFDKGTRQIGRLGIQSDWFPPEHELAVELFDRAVDLEAATSPIRQLVGAERLGLAAATLKALRRLEALEEDPIVDVRPRYTFEAVVGLEAFQRIAKAGSLPARVRTRRLAFKKPLGETLARVDLLRAVSAVRAIRMARSDDLDADATDWAWMCAGLCLDAERGRDLGRELYELGVACLHEYLIAYSQHAGFEMDLRRRAGDVKLRPYLRGVARWFEERDFEPTAEDRARVDSKKFEFRPPRLKKETRR